MKYCFLLACGLMLLFASCSKRGCGCEPSPTTFSFTLVDKYGKSAVKTEQVNNCSLYYLQAGNKVALDISHGDSFPVYNYIFNSSKAQTLPSALGINEFYLSDESGDIDTIWIEAEKISDMAYNITSLKFNGKLMHRDSTYGIYLLVK